MKKILIFVCFAIIFAAGITCDCVESLRIFHVRNLDEIALGIAGISATLFTLTIALLALIGDKNDSYLGFNFKKFYLEQNVVFLKQDKIVILGFLCVALGTFCLIPKFYNSLLALFCINLFLIFVSIRRILRMYAKSAREIEKDIESFLQNALAQKHADVSMITSFVDDWKRHYNIQSSSDFEKYKDIFWKMSKKFFLNNGDRKKVESACTGIIDSMLIDRTMCIEGFKLLYDAYYIFNSLLDHQGEKAKEESSFHLFRSISSDLMLSLKDMDLSEVELYIRWDRLVCDIIELDGYFFNENDKITIDEFSSVVNFCYMIGSHSAKLPKENFEWWGDSLRSFANGCGKTYYLPSEQVDLFAKCTLAFTEGLIENGDESLIKEYFYKVFVEEQTLLIEEIHSLSVFAVHCYMYYLAYCETSPYVSDEISNKCKRVLEDTNVKENVSNYIRSFSANEKNIYPFGNDNLDVFNENFIRRMKRLLLPYEKYAPHGGVKTLVLSGVVRNYCMYMVLWMSSSYNRLQILEKMIPVDSAIDYFRMYGERGVQGYPVFVKTVLEDIDVNENELNSMNLDLRQGLLSLCKKKIMIGGDNRFDDSVAKDSVEIIGKLQSYFDESLSGIKRDECDSLFNVRLLRATTLSGVSLNDTIGNEYELVTANLLGNLINSLEKKNLIKRIARKTFTDDENLLNFLEEKKEKIIIGSKHCIRPINYMNYRKNEELLKDFKFYSSAGCSFALFADSQCIGICIRNIQIKTREQKIDELNCRYDQDEKVYEYSPEPGIQLEFTKEELEVYLKKNKRIVEIYAEVGFSINENCKYDVVFA